MYKSQWLTNLAKNKKYILHLDDLKCQLKDVDAGQTYLRLNISGIDPLSDQIPTITASQAREYVFNSWSM